MIENMEATGTPDGKPPIIPVCPICSRECDTAYVRKTDGEPLGCENCVDKTDPVDHKEYERSHYAD